MNWQIEPLGQDSLNYATLYPETARELGEFAQLLEKQQDFFVAESPVFCGRAPGRLDLMGGIADYSGSLVLELPLASGIFVAVQQVEAEQENKLKVRSGLSGVSDGLNEVTYLHRELFPVDHPLTYALAQKLLNQDAQTSWAAYVLGVLIVLHREFGLVPATGLNIYVYSQVPPGKGVSSSAALEVATMQALAGFFDLNIEGREMAILCQKVENYIVGAPCGVMDQMTAACGRKNHLLALLCQPAEFQGNVLLPDELEIWGIDSGVRHAITGADYGSVRVGAFIGYRIIADLAGLKVKLSGDNQVSVEDPHWHGYLANISPSIWHAKFADKLPLQLTGAQFCQKYGGTTDQVTRVNPQQTYQVRYPTAHPIFENYRVSLFRAILEKPNLQEKDFRLLGELMYQAHASYTSCGLSTAQTDKLVDLIRNSSSGNLFGAKITGGGSGGTVAVLARKNSLDEIQQLANEYSQETGYSTTILGGSSVGASHLGAFCFML